MISLIHPSRGRPEKASNTMEDWWENAGYDDFEHILSIDTSDEKRLEYQAWFDNQWSRILINNNASVVEATNKAAQEADGDILLYLSDDFKCFTGWGQAVADEFKKYSGPALIKVDDCLQPFDVRVLTIPIMNRQCYEALGYFWHPGYRSMFVDEHLYWRTKKLGFLKFAPHLKFEHCHVSVGKAENDETYKRSAANWEQGKALFQKHKAAGFIE